MKADDLGNAPDHLHDTDRYTVSIPSVRRAEVGVRDGAYIAADTNS